MQTEMITEIPYGLALSDGDGDGTPCKVVIMSGPRLDNVMIESFTAQGIAVHVGEMNRFYPWHMVKCIEYDETIDQMEK